VRSSTRRSPKPSVRDRTDPGGEGAVLDRRRRRGRDIAGSREQQTKETVR